jgi:hypothetical protein
MLRVSELIRATLQRAQEGVATKHDLAPLRLSATAQSFATELMDAAMVRALAGPGLEPPPMGEDAERYGSAAVVAKRIFEDEIRNLHKRSISRGGAGAERIFINQPPLVERATGLTFPRRDRGLSRMDVLALVDKAAARLAGGTPTPDAWLAVLKFLRLDDFDTAEPDLDEDQDQNDERIRSGLVYAAALARSMPMTDAVIRRLQELRPAFPVFVDTILDAGDDDAGE